MPERSPMADRGGIVVIHGDGYVTVTDAVAAQRLASRAGRWRITMSPPSFIVLHREYQPGEDPGRIALAGDIAACGGLVDVINLIKSSSWTGALAAISGPARRTIYFRNGEVRTASSNLPEDRLGQILYRFGVITRKQLDEALAKVGPNAKMGKVLVNMGAVTTAELYRWVRRQVEEIFYAMLLVREGEFYFERDGKEPPGANLALSTQHLLLEGCRRMDELSYFRAKIKSSKVVLQRRHDAVLPEELTPTQRELLAHVDGRRTLFELARLCHLGEFEATHAAYGLLQAGIVEILEGPPPPSPTGPTLAELTRVIEAANWLLRAAYEALAARGEGPSYLRDLAFHLTTLPHVSACLAEHPLAPDGTLPAEALARKAQETGGGEPLATLLSWLDEIIRFAIFNADLAPDAEQEMRARIAEAVRKTGEQTTPQAP